MAGNEVKSTATKSIVLLHVKYGISAVACKTRGMCSRFRSQFLPNSRMGNTGIHCFNIGSQGYCHSPAIIFQPIKREQQKGWEVNK